MIQSIHQTPPQPTRVVVLGAKGFVGSTTINQLSEKKIPTLGLSRENIDLLEPNAAEKLVSYLQKNDTLVITSAIAPCKNYAMLSDNILMMKHICAALSQCKVNHVIYISSDAVYSDSMQKLSENSPTAPDSLHGIMHVSREMMLKSLDNISLLILRPSLLFGKNDPHNGYGPNQFYRLALKNAPIKLFGQGEEKRDHVYIEDVAELVHLAIQFHTQGTLNITTGEVVSFSEIAREVNQLCNSKNRIVPTPRTGPMPHNGYRAFDNTLCKKMFPNFRYTPLKEGLSTMHKEDALTP